MGEITDDDMLTVMTIRPNDKFFKLFAPTLQVHILDMMAQRLARRAEDREVPGSRPNRD